MLSTDSYYSQSLDSSAISSEMILSGSCGSGRTSRVRKVRLSRPVNGFGTMTSSGLIYRHGPNLGFSIRGGREHGTGFFVSHVEVGSEAHRQGLKIGDQIIRVNGYAVEDAVHKEVLQFISNCTQVVLKVRSVGMIPVKDNNTDVLSWQIIADGGSSLSSSPQPGEKHQDVKINLIVAPKSKLGCGICKGPDWKPGIFVQFTKEGGIAREAGLRPGDQILYCNGTDFSDIPFVEAVHLMKTSCQLDLLIRKSAGSDLFPGESSGYNSSASSVTGDQSPSWSDSKRLSMVKEESADLEDRLTNLDRFKTKKYNWPDDDEKPASTTYKPTIINLSENGIIIKNNGVEEETFSSDESVKLLEDVRVVSQQLDKKTVVVEIHRSNVDCSGQVEDTCSSSSSLSSALAMELERRKQKLVGKEQCIDERIQMNKSIKGVANDKLEQHTKLMDEFKKAHKRMFKSDEKSNNTEVNDRQATRSFTIQNGSSDEAPQERSTATNGGVNGVVRTSEPPPAPPLPTTTNLQPPKPPSNNPTLKPKKPKAPPVPIKKSTLSATQSLPPPSCPTPDYDTLSIENGSTANGRPEQSRPTRPVSVTIGQYPSGTLRKQPSRFEFLNGTEGKIGTDGIDGKGQPITSQLANELALTLNRSNLRKKTESDDVSCSMSKSQEDGYVRISLNANINALKQGKESSF